MHSNAYEQRRLNITRALDEVRQNLGEDTVRCSCLNGYNIWKSLSNLPESFDTHVVDEPRDSMEFKICISLVVPYRLNLVSLLYIACPVNLRRERPIALS